MDRVTLATNSDLPSVGGHVETQPKHAMSFSLLEKDIQIRLLKVKNLIMQSSTYLHKQSHFVPLKSMDHWSSWNFSRKEKQSRKLLIQTLGALLQPLHCNEQIKQESRVLSFGRIS